MGTPGAIVLRRPQEHGASNMNYHSRAWLAPEWAAVAKYVCVEDVPSDSKISRRALDYLSKGAHGAQRGTVQILWNYIITGRWSVSAHRLAGCILDKSGDRDSWWGECGYREAFAWIEVRAQKMLDSAGAEWDRIHWDAAVILWAIAQGSKMTDLPSGAKDASDHEREKRPPTAHEAANMRKLLDAELFRKVGCAMRDRLRPSFEEMHNALQENASQEEERSFLLAETYWYCRLAVDLSAWNETDRSKRHGLEHDARDLYRILLTFNNLFPSNQRAVLNAMAIASRFTKRKDYDDLLGRYETATGLSRRKALIHLLEVIEKVDGGDMTDSDFVDIIDWYRNVAALRRPKNYRRSITAAMALAIAMGPLAGTTGGLPNYTMDLGSLMRVDLGSLMRVDLGSLMRADLGSLLGRNLS